MIVPTCIERGIMAHLLVLVVVTELQPNVASEVQRLMDQHLGDPAEPDICFDFYKIGGAWNGIFAGLLPGEFVGTDCLGGRVQGNICRLEDVPFEPSAVVTPDGTLHFFGWSFDDEPLAAEHAQSWAAIRSDYRSAYAVAVDGHS